MYRKRLPKHLTRNATVIAHKAQQAQLQRKYKQCL